MLLSKDKKIFIYFFLLIFLGSINNKNFSNSKIFHLKNFKLEGLDEKEKSNWLEELNQIKDNSIFFLPKDKIIEILNSNNLIETFLISKNYPSDLNISIKKTLFVANIKIKKKDFLIGNNKKLIRTDSVNLSLPLVLGNPSIDDFFLIKENIFKSMMNMETIQKFYFFPSGRWDLELKNGTLIKLPLIDIVESINNYHELLKLPQFKKIKFFDMRIKNQIIINEL